MSYQALYRIWRPEGFSSIVGQDPIVTTLVNQIKAGRIAHAYLFCGSRGTGKTSTAKVFARTINCESPLDNGDPCGVCEPCLALKGENNMDVIEIDAASNNGVDEIRELRNNIKYPPTIGRYKVYIVDEVHMLSTGAFNALLKTLEEPPAHAVFILATTEPQRLPPTILSRCQRYDFKRIPANVIVEKLTKEVAFTGREAEPEALLDIARAAEGGMRDAESLLDMCLAYGNGRLTSDWVRNVLGSSDRRSLFDFAQALIDAKAADALTIVDHQMRDGRDPQVFAREVAQHMRSLMLAQLMPSDLAGLLELAAEDAAQLVAQAKNVPSEKFMRIMELFIQSENDMRFLSQPRAVLELCTVRACHPEREQSVEALLERVAQLERAPVVRVAPAEAPAESKPAEKAPAQEKAPAPEKKSASSPASNVPPADMQNWDRVVLMASERHPSLHPLIKSIQFAGLNGDAAKLIVPKKWLMYLKVLETEAKKKILEDLMTESFGRPIHALLSLEGAAAAKTLTNDGASSINQAYDTFGRENVSIVDDFDDD